MRLRRAKLRLAPSVCKACRGTKRHYRTKDPCFPCAGTGKGAPLPHERISVKGEAFTVRRINAGPGDLYKAYIRKGKAEFAIPRSQIEGLLFYDDEEE